MQRTYQLSADPLYYVMGGFFSVLTTAFPAIMGQPRVLQLSQTLVLALFLVIPLRRGALRHAAGVLALWLVVQLTLMAALVWLAPGRVEQAIPGGFRVAPPSSGMIFAVGPSAAAVAPPILAQLGEAAAVALAVLIGRPYRRLVHRADRQPGGLRCRQPGLCPGRLHRPAHFSAALDSCPSRRI